MKTISYFQKCFNTFILFCFVVSTAFAQLGNGPGNGGNNTPTPSISNDFDIVGFTIEGGNTVIRETMVNATISLKNKGGATKKSDHVALYYIPDLTAYQKDPSKNQITVPDIEFNASGEAKVQVNFNGYANAGTYQSRAIINPNSSVAESNYNNNTQDITVTAQPHKVEIDVKFEIVTIFHDMETAGDCEFRMKMKVGKKNTAGQITWLGTAWYPREPDPENNAKDYVQMQNNNGGGKSYTIGKILKITNISDEDYIVFETTAVDDDKNSEDVGNTDDDNMGKCADQFYQVKTWANPISVGSGFGRTNKSDTDDYSVQVSAKIVKLD